MKDEFSPADEPVQTPFRGLVDAPAVEAPTIVPDEVIAEKTSAAEISVVETNPIVQTEPREKRQRDDGTTLIGLYHFLIGGVWLLPTCLFTFPTFILGVVGVLEDADAFIGMVITGFLAAAFMVLSILYLAIGYGLWTTRQWGRTAAVALSVLRLFFVPIGTVIGGLMLWHLMKEDVAAQFE